MLNRVFKLCVIMMSVVRLSGILLSVYAKFFLIVAIPSGVLLTVIQPIVILRVVKHVIRLRVIRTNVVAPVKADAF